MEAFFQGATFILAIRCNLYFTLAARADQTKRVFRLMQQQRITDHRLVKDADAISSRLAGAASLNHDEIKPLTALHCAYAGCCL